jgi:orotate phosphoribosyltransferase
MQVPSGAIYYADDEVLLRSMAEHKFVEYSERPFMLKSKIESHVYVFGREDMTDNPELEWKVGRKVAKIVYANTDADEARRQILIGIPTAGNAIAQAGAMASLRVLKQELIVETARPIGHRIMREQLKLHGAHQTWVNGKPDLEKHRYWMVDNVATDGQSKFEAAQKLEADGYPAKLMPCLIWVDRQQGAVERLKSAGFTEIIVAFNLLDVTFAFGEMKVWPKSAVRAVEEEIKAHQFKV